MTLHNAMNVSFHALTSLAIGHASAPHLERASSRWRAAAVVATACTLGLASHGVLDGLRHAYPLPSLADVVLAAVLGLGWIGLVRPEFRVLFALVFASAVIPDVVDLGPALAAQHLGLALPQLPVRPFPWHWREGSGSLYRLTPHDAIVSWTNHAIIVAFSTVTIWSHRRVLRVRARV